MQDLLRSIRAKQDTRAGRPILVALDGRSGAGKSTLAQSIQQALGGPEQAATIPGDDFYDASRTDAFWDSASPEARADLAIDWRRLRAEALEPLLQGQPAAWRTYDYPARRPDGTFPLAPEPGRREPAPVVILDGAYSARPELRDLIDIAVLVDIGTDTQRQRLLARDGQAAHAWLARWAPAEDYHFTRVCPRASFHAADGGVLVGAHGRFQ
ncbi:MAG: zeta toxin family protein [Planctomycetota bacterium]